MKIIVTGANGFIGKNLVVRLGEMPTFNVTQLSRSDSPERQREIIASADAVIHLAGVNRPSDPNDFIDGNIKFTAYICEMICQARRAIPLIMASSAQAEVSNPYGASKRAAEIIVKEYAEFTGASVAIYRLPNVFGKWCRENYNSVVATFCFNISNNLPIQIHNPDAKISLLYIDDLVNDFIETLSMFGTGIQYREILPCYEITVGRLAKLIKSFKDSQDSLIIERVGVGLERALYATYISHFRPAQFSYSLPKYSDIRGDFVEMLKTYDSGQFSYFTTQPGATRGGHYHHTKNEKFLVIRGQALFSFRQIITGECFQLHSSGSIPQVVETIPGWTHAISNIGADELIVMLWANEIFDKGRPDTIASKV